MEKELSKEEILKNNTKNGDYTDKSLLKAMQEFADQQCKKEAIAFQSEIERLKGLVDLKEAERKQWADMCIKKQDKIEHIMSVLRITVMTERFYKPTLPPKEAWKQFAADNNL